MIKSPKHPRPKPLIDPETIEPIHPQWILAFVDGEGCFAVDIDKKTKQVRPEFCVVQHQRNIHVLMAIQKYFGVGSIGRNHDTRYAVRVRGKNDILQKIVPFFEKHKLKTDKNKDFLVFVKILKIMEKNDHLTEVGLAKIREFKTKMIFRLFQQS